MTYICEFCNYTTNRKLNYERHLNSAKHSKKVSELPTPIPHRHTMDTPKTQFELKNHMKCIYCHQSFSRKSSLNRHLKTCTHKNDAVSELKMKVKEKDTKLQEKNKEINQLKHLVLYFEDLLSMTHRTLDKSVSAISYANMYLVSQQAKPLEEPSKDNLKLLYHNKRYPKNEKIYKKKNQDELQKMYSRKLYDNATYEYAGGTKQLAEYITEIIVEIYKKDDPKDQAVWNSDSARLNFIIREFIENTELAKWQKDKKGVKVTKVIIDPIIEELKHVLEKEIVNSSKIMAEKGGFVREEELRRVNRSAKIIKDIDDGVLQNAILKKMAGHFYLNKNIEDESGEVSEEDLGSDIEVDKEELIYIKPMPKNVRKRFKRKKIDDDKN